MSIHFTTGHWLLGQIKRFSKRSAGFDYYGRGLSMIFVKNANSDDLYKLLQIAMAEQDLQRRAELW